MLRKMLMIVTYCIFFLLLSLKLNHKESVGDECESWGGEVMKCAGAVMQGDRSGGGQ